MKKFLFKLMFTTIVTGISSLNAQSSLNTQSSGKPNVIIIFIDDMGYGDLSCYGNKQVSTANIDALAKRGTRFTQFYSNSPVCSPSRSTTLITLFSSTLPSGIFPGHTAINGTRIPPSYKLHFLPCKSPALQGGSPPSL